MAHYLHFVDPHQSRSTTRRAATHASSMPWPVCSATPSGGTSARSTSPSPAAGRPHLPSHHRQRMRPAVFRHHFPRSHPVLRRQHDPHAQPVENRAGRHPHRHRRRPAGGHLGNRLDERHRRPCRCVDDVRRPGHSASSAPVSMLPGSTLISILRNSVLCVSAWIAMYPLVSGVPSSSLGF